MPSRLLIPLLNRTVTTFRGPTWYLDADISVDSLTQDEQGLVFSDVPEEYRSLIPQRPKAVRVSSVVPETAEQDARAISTVATFVMNYFRRERPLAAAFSLLVTQRRKVHLDAVYDLDAVDSREAQSSRFSFRPGVDRGTVTAFYKVVDAARQKHPGILLPLGRFNSALMRSNNHDQIVDLTIALEALITGTTELRHRFAMHNAWAAESDPQKRGATMKSLLALYDARSAIVHGAAMSEREYRHKIQPIVDNWTSHLQTAANAIGYHLLYLYNNELDTWSTHQTELCLGIAARVTD